MTRDDLTVSPVARLLQQANDYRDLFAGLTPDEARVITGLVRAMREHRSGRTFGSTPDEMLQHAQARAYLMLSDGKAVPSTTKQATEAAWHIAHAISQMGES